MTIDITQPILIMFGAIVTIITGTAGYKINNHIKNIERGAKLRERKQEIHYMKLEATIEALARTFEKPYSDNFLKNYKEILSEKVRESDDINQI